jgi:hypothetical protein
VQVADLYDPKEQWASYVINAVKAKEFQTKDVNYIVRKGEVRCLAVTPPPPPPPPGPQKVHRLSPSQDTFSEPVTKLKNGCSGTGH